MDGIDQFIKQQNQMLQMEKNNLSFLEASQTQHTLEHEKGNVFKTQMADESTSVEDDKIDDEEQQRIQFLGEHPNQTTLATDNDRGKKHFAEQYELSPHSKNVNEHGMHKQSEIDRRDQNHQVYLAEMADKEALEFRRKIGANAQFHHDQELKQLEHQRDVNEANNRQHDHDYNHDKGKKHFTEQYAQSPHSYEFNDQGKHIQKESDIRHQEYQVYLADEANKESQEFRRKIGANVQYNHQHHDHELQSHQRDINQVNNRQHGHDLIDIERDIRRSDAKDSHQGLNENLRNHDFSGTKYNADAVVDRNKEQIKVDHRKKMEHKRGLKKQIDEKNAEQEGLRERDRFEEKNLIKNAHSQCDEHHQFYPLRQHTHDTPRLTEGGVLKKN